MMFSLLSIFIVIVWIILGTSFTKLHPFIVLLIAAIILSILLGIGPLDATGLIFKGFFKIIKNIGLLILFGTIIGTALEQSNGTLSLAKGIIKSLQKLPLPYAVSCIGYLVSIPVFCDAAFVILSQLNKTLSYQTKTPMVGLTVALSTGLFAPHVLVPPTPGPLAAAANLNLENLILLIGVGGSIALILIFVGGWYGNYLIKKNKYIESNESSKNPHTEKIIELPNFSKAILPILIPISLMCLGTLLKILPSFIGLEYLIFLTKPSAALGIGLLFAFRLLINQPKKNINTVIKKGFKQAIPILVITGMGGALGRVIQTIPLEDYALEVSTFSGFGILIPFMIAALLKTAQGSSTVAIITTSSIIFPLLSVLGLDSEMGKVWAIMALGVGSMTVSHANDSYFWIVSQMSGMDVKTAYRTHTVGTLLQGTVGIIVVLIGHTIWTAM
ncbi:GntP family permease [Flavobacteriaceae bacterium]|nr:GntP family permease [Flavobacteriaceae bacterium]MDB4063145.1 GntP family permease [Flavobacteriaceae bacterium]MDB4255812.1 GntP family permease [Flavobacteriaceae bacterium]MDC1392713.1 GntP family permease [Flavobacteriaceae bacterium]